MSVGGVEYRGCGDVRNLTPREVNPRHWTSPRRIAVMTGWHCTAVRKSTRTHGGMAGTFEDQLYWEQDQLVQKLEQAEHEVREGGD